MFRKKNLALLVCLFASSMTAFAQDNTTHRSVSSTLPATQRLINEEQKVPHIGFLIGANNPEGGATSSTEMGIDVGYQPYIPFGVGLQVMNTKNVSPSGENLDRTSVLARGTYNFGGTLPVIKESYVGLGLGPIFKESGTDMAYVPMIGFDIPLSKEYEQILSLGALAKYNIIDGSDQDAASLDAVMKYWF